MAIADAGMLLYNGMHLLPAGVIVFVKRLILQLLVQGSWIRILLEAKFFQDLNGTS